VGEEDVAVGVKRHGTCAKLACGLRGSSVPRLGCAAPGRDDTKEAVPSHLFHDLVFQDGRDHDLSGDHGHGSGEDGEEEGGLHCGWLWGSEELCGYVACWADMRRWKLVTGRLTM
jgi:hypothetical protein